MSRPMQFYKFCTAKVAKINLTTRRLRFSSPLLFNDPFDCYFPPGFRSLRRNVAAFEKRHYAILTGEEILPAGSSAAFNLAPLVGLIGSVPPEAIERARKNHKANLHAIANQFNRDSQINWDDTMRRLRLLSLCADGKNPLLWSHYADKHRGVTFEFDASLTGGMPFGIARPVKYRKRVPRAYSRKDFIEDALGLNSLTDASQALLPLVMTKSLEWQYENEWRIVGSASEKEGNLSTDLPFSPRSLSKIFFGCRISSRNRKAIERLATGDFAHVEVFQARQSQERFALEFDRIR